jgi:hypothetical protein
VAGSLAEGFELLFYRDHPDSQEPLWESLKVKPGDWVLAVNYFGVRQEGRWADYQKENPEVIVVEDHSHDPFSPWARQSKAPYAFASLRKTLPLPDGAVLWSPQERWIPEPKGPTPGGAYWKLEAMLLKGVYLKGGRLEKEVFRGLQTKGEASLALSLDGRASEFTAGILPLLPVAGLRKKRAANVSKLLALLSGSPLPFKPLFSRWPKGSVPFNLVLLCETETGRERLLSHLIAHQVYAAVHWPQEGKGKFPLSGDKYAQAISRRILTIPVDFRCRSIDLERLAELLRGFH